MIIPHFDSFTDAENELFAEMFEERVAIMVIDGKVLEDKAIKLATVRIMGQILRMRKQ